MLENRVDPLHARYKPIMPHEDYPDGEGLSGVFFTESSENCGEEEDDVLSSLSNEMGLLNIKERAALGRGSSRLNFQS